MTAIVTAGAGGTATPRRRGCLVGGIFGGLGALAFAAVMTTVILAVGIWPGEAKLTAPLLCPDDRPDAFVVTDTYSVRPGETTTNFTLYCVGERGEFTDVGFFRPAALLTVLHGAILLLLVLGVGGLAAGRRRRRRAGIAATATEPADASTPAEAPAPMQPIIGNPIEPDDPLKI